MNYRTRQKIKKCLNISRDVGNGACVWYAVSILPAGSQWSWAWCPWPVCLVSQVQSVSWLCLHWSCWLRLLGGSLLLSGQLGTLVLLRHEWTSSRYCLQARPHMQIHLPNHVLFRLHKVTLLCGTFAFIFFVHLVERENGADMDTV